MSLNENGWKPYAGSFLGIGDEVRFVAYAGRGMSGKTGIVERRLRKNFAIVVDGKTWRVPPALIDAFRVGDPDNVPVVKATQVKCNPDRMKNCSVGDTVLMYRGKFDVVEVVSLTATKVRCRVVGRSNGTVYGYKPEWFVQKLDNSCFVK